MHEISVKSDGDPLVRRRSDHVFFVGSAIAIFATAVLAFSFALKKTDLSSQVAASSWVKIHVVTFSSWILLFFTQTVLVASRRTDLHRRLGVAGACLAAVMIGVTVYITLEAIRQGNAVLKMPAFEAFIFYTVPHVDIILFTILVTAALLMRGKPEIHKRLMLLTTVALLDAVADRLPIIWRAGRGAHFVVQDMFVVAGIAYDLVSRGRISPAYIWGGLLILVCPPGAVLLYQHFIPAEWGMMLNFRP
jgi:heme/copper-type cytochrome/quinol oxidase subunit 3